MEVPSSSSKLGDGRRSPRVAQIPTNEPIDVHADPAAPDPAVPDLYVHVEPTVTAGVKRTHAGVKRESLGPAIGGEELAELLRRREDVHNRLLNATGISKEDADATGILTMSSATILAKESKQPKKILHWDHVLREMVSIMNSKTYTHA